MIALSRYSQVGCPEEGGQLIGFCYAFLSFLWSSPSWEAIVKLFPLATIFNSSHSTMSALDQDVPVFFPSLHIKTFVGGHTVPGNVSRHVSF